MCWQAQEALLTQICSTVQMPPNDDFMQSLSGTLQVDDCLIPNYMLLMLQGNFGLLCDSGMFNEPGPGEAIALVHTMLSAAHVRHAPKEQAGDGGSEKKMTVPDFHAYARVPEEPTPSVAEEPTPSVHASAVLASTSVLSPGEPSGAG